MRTGSALLATLAAPVASAGACTDPTLDDQTPRDADGEITSGGDLGVPKIRVGDCLASIPDAEVIAEVDAVPCSTPHAAEAYASFSIGDGPSNEFPGLDAVTALADQGCLDRFERFVGISYPESAFYVHLIYPSRQTWTMAGDREVVRMVARMDGEPWTGSAERSAT